MPAAPSLGLQLHPDGAGHRHSLNLPSKLYVAKVLLPVSMAERAEAPLPGPAFHSGTEEEALCPRHKPMILELQLLLSLLVYKTESSRWV